MLIALRQAAYLYAKTDGAGQELKALPIPSFH
jgi:hypothetical protein